jgi:hypothetical protein
MATSSSSKKAPDQMRVYPVTALDVWMLVSTFLAAVGFLAIRSRIANYVYVLRWVKWFVQVIL